MPENSRWITTQSMVDYARIPQTDNYKVSQITPEYRILQTDNYNVSQIMPEYSRWIWIATKYRRLCQNTPDELEKSGITGTIAATETTPHPASAKYVRRRQFYPLTDVLRRQKPGTPGKNPVFRETPGHIENP